MAGTEQGADGAARAKDLLERHRLTAVAATLDVRATLTAHAPPFESAGTVPVPGPSELFAASLSTALLPHITIAPEEPAAGDEATGHHELVVSGTLGEGGMGRVLLARQRSLERDVAIKVLRPASATAFTAAALLGEGRVMGSLEHPGIVPVHALGVDGRGLPVLVMKRVEGVPWSDLLAQPNHPAWARLNTAGDAQLLTHLEILMSVSNAVHFAHRRGVIHRDIKPANVLVGEFGEVHLADWGIALRVRRADGTPVRLSQTGPFVGTPSSMAPEMLSGSPQEIDERTDVYLLGATLHEVLTARPRHAGDTLGDVLLAILDSGPVAWGGDVPDELGAICNRATATSPADRYASALEFRSALADYLRHRASIALAHQALTRLEALGAVLAADDRRAAQELMTECRFAFVQALREWPDNRVARDGLDRCLRAMVGFELDRGNLEGAQALLEQLAAPAADLRDRIESMKASRRSEQERVQRLERLARDRDLAIGARMRRVAVLLVATTAVGGVFTVAILRARGASARAANRALLGVPLAVLLVSAIVAWLARKNLLTNGANRNLLGTLMTTMLGVLVHRLLSLRWGETPANILSVDLLLFAVVVTVLSIHHARGLALAALVFLAGVGAVQAAPGRALTLFAVFGSLGLAVSASLLRRREPHGR